MLIVVINPAGVNIRTSPGISVTSAEIMPAGSEIEISHTVTIGKDKWGKITGTQRKFVAINHGSTQYCAVLEPC